jgi:hypothetical protein
MPSQVNPDYIPPNYRPNYRVPQTRTVRTPAQPNPRDTYDYFAEQRELNRVRQEQIAAANRRMQALMAQRRTQQNAWNQQAYRNGYDPYNTRNNEYVGPRWADYAYNPAYPKGYNWQYPGGKYYRQPKEPAAPTFNTGIYHTQAEWDAYRKSLNKPATKTTPPTYTRNLPESLQDAIARGEQSPWGYDSGAPANKQTGVNRSRYKKASGALQTALAAANNYNEWYDIWHMPRETLSELIARGAVDPWASDPYEIGGSPYAESVYNEQYAEDTGWDGYGGWGGGGSYSSSPGIYGDSVRKNQWYSTLLQWNIT